jgi:hypothetical protein
MVSVFFREIRNYYDVAELRYIESRYFSSSWGM